MTITKIYIGAFGGLKDYTLQLDKGLNVVFGENENGKTTIMAFIKMMFYGSGRNSRKLGGNLRAKYTPWNCDTMGGRIYFEHNSQRYCLEREFKKSDATDRVTLRNLDLGTSETVGHDIGKRFFGLSDSAFERSVFIDNAPSYESDETANGEFDARLSNIASTGDEGASFQLISKRINAAIGELVTQRHVGIYDKGQAKLEELRAEYIKADASARYREELGDKIKALKKELTDTKSEYERVKKIVDNENDIRSAEKLREYLDVKSELDELNKTLVLNDGNLIDSVFIGKINFCLSKLDTETTREEEKRLEVQRLEDDIKTAEKNRSLASPQRLEELKGDIESLKQQKENVASKYNGQTEALLVAETSLKAASKKRKIFNPALLISGILLVIITAIIYSLYPPLIALAAAGIVLIVLGFIIRPLDRAAITAAEKEVAALQHKSSELKSKETALQGEINDLANEMNLMAAALNTDKALIDQKKAELEDRREQLKAASDKKSAAEEELKQLYTKFSVWENEGVVRQSLSDLTTRTDEQKALKLRLKYLSADLDNISYSEAEDKLRSIENADTTSNTDFESAKKSLEELNERGINLSSSLSALLTELKAELKQAVEPDRIEREIAELTLQLERQKEYMDAAQTTLSVLEDSFAEMRRGYGSALEKRTLEIFSNLTGGRYNNINISKSLEIEAETSGEFGTRSIEYLSKGTIDQAYISLRLALSELITDDKEKLPFFLDDAFSQYDDKRAQTAIRFLKEYSNDSQAILFTCHNSICDYAEECGVVIKKLK